MLAAMPDLERTYSAECVIDATPWDVYELLVDPEQQSQWRERYATHAATAEEQPYTRVVFEDGVVMELEPEGSGTLLKATRTRSGNGLTGKLGILLTSRSTVESEMLSQLKRIGATLASGGI